MYRPGRRRRPKKVLPEGLTVGAYVVLILPLLLVAAPFVLTWFAWQERRRLCPLCNQRGTLHPCRHVPKTEADDPEDEFSANELLDNGWPTRVRRCTDLERADSGRISPERAVMCCSVCGLRIRRVDLESRPV